MDRTSKLQLDEICESFGRRMGTCCPLAGGISMCKVDVSLEMSISVSGLCCFSIREAAISSVLGGFLEEFSFTKYFLFAFINYSLASCSSLVAKVLSSFPCMSIQFVHV